jgi:hypothetical protein
MADLTAGPFGHVASVVGFGSLGYYLYHVEQRQ